MKIQPSRKGDIYVQKNLGIQVIHIIHFHIHGNNRIIVVIDFAKKNNQLHQNVAKFCFLSEAQDVLKKLWCSHTARQIEKMEKY